VAVIAIAVVEMVTAAEATAAATTLVHSSRHKDAVVNGVSKSYSASLQQIVRKPQLQACAHYAVNICSNNSSMLQSYTHRM
jgi:conjugal transfer/entry exclusion protein